MSRALSRRFSDTRSKQTGTVSSALLCLVLVASCSFAKFGIVWALKSLGSGSHKGGADLRSRNWVDKVNSIHDYQGNEEDGLFGRSVEHKLQEIKEKKIKLQRTRGI